MKRQYKTVLAKMEWFKLRTPTEPKLFCPIDISYLLFFFIPTSFSINVYTGFQKSFTKFRNNIRVYDLIFNNSNYNLIQRCEELVQCKWLFVGVFYGCSSITTCMYG